MLEALRKAATTWVAKLLLLLLVASFAIWGVSGQVGTGGSDAIVTAGDTQMSEASLRLEYLQQLQSAQGDNVTVQSVVDALVAGAVLDEEARRLGLGISEDQLAQMTVSDPNFQGPDGAFSRPTFERVLQSVGLRGEDYLNDRASRARRQQLVQAASAGTDVPEVFLRGLALYQGEQRNVSLLELPQSLVQPIEDPADDALQAYFDANRERYRAPEYRAVELVEVTPQAIAEPGRVTAEAVEAEYQRRVGSQAEEERRTVQQLPFADEEAARNARQALQSGESFESLVQQSGRTMGDVSLGSVTRADLRSSALADAAFNLQSGEVSDVVSGPFGPVLLRVTGIEENSQPSLAEMEPQIRQDLATVEARSEIQSLYNALEDNRAAGDTLAEAAEKLALPLTEIAAVDAQGNGPDGQSVPALQGKPDLLSQLFSAEPNVETLPQPLDGGGYAFYDVTSITPDRDLSLDEAREQVVADWREEQLAARLAKRAETLLGELRGGASLQQIAEQTGSELRDVQNLTRLDDGGSGVGPAGLAAIFDVAEGGSGEFAVSGGGGRTLFVVDGVSIPIDASASSIPQQQQALFDRTVAADLVDQMIGELIQDYPPQLNQANIERALQQL